MLFSWKLICTLHCTSRVSKSPKLFNLEKWNLACTHTKSHGGNRLFIFAMQVYFSSCYWYFWNVSPFSVTFWGWFSKICKRWENHQNMKPKKPFHLSTSVLRIYNLDTKRFWGVKQKIYMQALWNLKMFLLQRHILINQKKHYMYIHDFFPHKYLKLVSISFSTEILKIWRNFH